MDTILAGLSQVRKVGRQAAHGTLMLAIGLGTPRTLSAGLFYLVNSTLVAAVWFLLADRISAARGDQDMLQPRAMAGAWVPLGAAFFIAAVAAAGVPPLAGFFGKAMLLQAAGHAVWAGWVAALVLGSSLATMVALARAGSTLFWSPSVETSTATMPTTSPSSRLHGTAIGALLLAIVGLAALAGPLSHYAAATAQQMVQRQPYIDAVLGARPAPAAYDVRKEMRERGEAK